MKQVLAVFIILLLVPFTAVAQDACEGNFDCDQDVDGTDAAVFKSDFGRSPFKNPCPACTPACEFPAPVPKTGQTDCWDENGSSILCQTCYIGQACTNKTGQDGMWEKGVTLPEPRFTINGDGTVTDNLTGLIWTRQADCFGTQQTWQEALDTCNDLSTGNCGLTDGSVAGDWRLPNRRELFSLIHDSYYHPAVSNTAGTGQHTHGDPFFNLYTSYYWTSTTSGYPTKSAAWYVNMVEGHVVSDWKDNQFYVWPVRGGQ